MPSVQNTIRLLLLLLIPMSLQAQFRSRLSDTTVSAKLISLSYSVQFPAADMADRFGANNNLGSGFYFKFSHDFLIGVEANYFFGGVVHEDTMLNYLYNSSGNLTGIDGLYETVFVNERGYSFFGKFGKIIPVHHSNPNSGLTLIVGAGFLEHKIKLSDPNNSLPQVEGDYAKGYDRLTNGFAISQYIGYTNLDSRKLLNFNIGLEATEAFTKNRRDWNFDQMRKDDEKRLDVLLGIRIGFILPFYGSHEQKMYTF